MKRRDVLKAGAAAGAAALVSGCDSSRGWNAFARHLEPAPAPFPAPSSAAIDLETHILNRLSLGPRPGDVDAVRKAGVEAWIDRQLDPESIEDWTCELRVRRFESLHATAGDLFEFKKPVVEVELAKATILRAVHSNRPLLQVMVHFWTDHFNIGIGKGRCAWLKTADDRDVIRHHALGRFPDLLRASALSPAMLVYLDGDQNRRAQGSEKPNENYARELLELHTLGVKGGYSQRDVMDAARCLTGWRVLTGWNRGKVVFEPAMHDDGSKRVLGVEIPAGQGEKDLDLLLDILVRHPSTAKHLAWKLCRRFVSDEPPGPLIDRVADAFTESRGDIKTVMRCLVRSEEFRSARGTRLKRPFHFVVSALRALEADTDGGRAIQGWLERMGQAPFHYPTPDGYPEEPGPWLGTLLWRWNFSLDLAGRRIGGTQVDLKALASRGEIAPHLLGRTLSAEEREALQGLGDELAIGVLLASPGFQRY